MTIDQFIERLSKTRRKWFVQENGHIRAQMGRVYDICCPITGLPIPGVRAEGVRIVAGDIGLAWSDARTIIAAADRSRGYSASLRNRILCACGLKES